MRRLLIFKKINSLLCSRLNLCRKKIRNRIPDKLVDFTERKIVPYLAIILIASFTLVANVAKASEINSDYSPSEEVLDLSPSEVATVVSVVSPYTAQLEEDPLTVALAIEDNNYLGKPVLADTQITNTPAVAGTTTSQKRSKTITYTVEDNDTISKIAWNYGLKIATVKATNGLSSDNIKPGQQLKLPPQDVDTSTLANLTKKATTTASKTPFKGTFRKPTSGWDMSQPFGHTSFENWHDGIDLTSRAGLTLMAAASGKVVATNRGWGGGYGNHVVIDHGNGFKTLYGHMASFSVTPGQWVNQGQKIGIMGNTGWSTGTHIHFKIMKNGTAVNPMNYL